MQNSYVSSVVVQLDVGLTKLHHGVGNLSAPQGCDALPQPVNALPWSANARKQLPVHTKGLPSHTLLLNELWHAIRQPLGKSRASLHLDLYNSCRLRL